ncbi:uncharacterized protein TRAVEDRAFT_47344 [Trametes versicolor FP-101664 SS1]|uniref:uncharacterized protein n=1 Tax=Trametes versicolor (strain FP-101664) TaxID=717944 RepID=UPI0004623269|nr:uncharacterized protein TRAVEDRAFT_47344 [Trametes versicolor FP-101664 SS1]EIW58172.1 hypothetical protein TRAVEDRAFT_47344 [Trametes versicolor FP-101664 SS1]
MSTRALKRAKEHIYFIEAPAGTTRAGIDENKVASSLAVRPSGVLCLNPADVIFLPL